MNEKIQKLQLNMEGMAEAFFDDAVLLGIVAPIKGYQFCWHVNRLLGMDFRLNHDLEIRLKKKSRDYYFSVFEYHEENSFMSHYIYANGFDGEYLLPEVKHLDFLWMMKNEEMPYEALRATIQLVKTIPAVQLVAEMPCHKIKNKEHLVL